MTTVERFFQIAVIITINLVAVSRDWVCARSKLLQLVSKRFSRNQITGPRRLKNVLESLGGSFIKLGQLLALQPDVLPMEYCHELYSLLDRVTPIPFAQISRVFEQEVNLKFDEVFDDFDPVVIARGSIGQVYAAKFQGRKVAVKIQRPDTISSFERDVRLMKSIVWIIEKFRLHPIHSVSYTHLTLPTICRV